MMRSLSSLLKKNPCPPLARGGMGRGGQRFTGVALDALTVGLITHNTVQTVKN
jgi:hypothetical protein